tara:strand:- start:17880 stop:18332 length:453 start_codon:yes stop_codon:yes gene_type:complete
MPEITPIGNSPLLQAIVDQTYGSKEEMLASEQTEVDLSSHFLQKAYQEMSKSQDFADYLDIPSEHGKQIEDDITEPHPNMKDYDHSLEMDRLPLLRQKHMEETYGQGAEFSPLELDDGSELTITDNSDYENINPEDVPNLGGLFDDNFGI